MQSAVVAARTMRSSWKDLSQVVLAVSYLDLEIARHTFCCGVRSSAPPPSPRCFTLVRLRCYDRFASIAGRKVSARNSKDQPLRRLGWPLDVNLVRRLASTKIDKLGGAIDIVS